MKKYLGKSKPVSKDYFMDVLLTDDSKRKEQFSSVYPIKLNNRTIPVIEFYNKKKSITEYIHCTATRGKRIGGNNNEIILWEEDGSVTGTIFDNNIVHKVYRNNISLAKCVVIGISEAVSDKEFSSFAMNNLNKSKYLPIVSSESEDSITMMEVCASEDGGPSLKLVHLLRSFCMETELVVCKDIESLDSTSFAMSKEFFMENYSPIA